MCFDSYFIISTTNNQFIHSIQNIEIHFVIYVQIHIPRNSIDISIFHHLGKFYYVFNSHVLEEGFPKPLRTLGLPESLKKIDAVVVWGHNNRTYFYSGDMYWR